MSIPIEERYKLMFEHHKFVSEYRISLIKVWGGMYVALAATFVWTQTNLSQFSWIIGFVSTGITILMWVADIRHRPAIRACKDVAKDIETDSSSGIPEKQRYFSQLEKGYSHSKAIDIFAIATLILLIIGTLYILCNC